MGMTIGRLRVSPSTAVITIWVRIPSLLQGRFAIYAGAFRNLRPFTDLIEREGSHDNAVSKDPYVSEDSKALSGATIYIWNVFCIIGTRMRITIDNLEGN